jgi:hypothetical protein
MYKGERMITEIEKPKKNRKLIFVPIGMTDRCDTQIRDL